jgi:hypothetical protein
MTIPNLPTDNLYKFVALTGVILLLVSIFYPELRRQELNEEITILNGEVEKQEFERLLLKDQTDKLRKKIEDLDEVCNCGTKSVVNDSIIVRPIVTSGPKEVVELSNQIELLIKERNEIVRQISLKAIEINTKDDLIGDKRANLDELNEAANTFGPVSLVIAILGFLFWFERTQKYQDRILKGQFGEYIKNELCQSCGMRLDNDDVYLQSSVDQKEKIRYCSDCFKEGQFTEPAITFKEMKDKVRNRCKELGFGKLVTFIYLRRLHDLERWLPKFRWK